VGRGEQKAVIFLLGAVVLLTSIDVAADLHFGSSLRHILVEVLIILAALTGAIYFWRRVFADLRAELRDSEAHTELWRQNAERWQREAAQFVEGLSKAIDRQFEEWELTPSEKEVALLLIKGLSLKEIASIRDVREKTVRQQSQAIYRKGGLEGRADLAAYFLEDLLSPFPMSRNGEARQEGPR
jgi:DNA-binding CsgD family transcriptional regulator